MVKNLPTVERSTKIRFGKNVPDSEVQAENTIVFNASNDFLEANTSNAIYMSPMRLLTDPDDQRFKILGFNQVTKEITDSNVTLRDIGTKDFQSITETGNTTTETVEFNNPGTSVVTISNVGIANSSPVHTLDVGSNLYVDDTGSNVLFVSGNTYIKENLVIDGNVLINGLTTTVNTENLTVTDAIIELGKNNISGDTTIDLGLLLARPESSSNVTVGFLEGSDEIVLAYTQSSSSEKTLVPETSESVNVHVYGKLYTEDSVGIVNTSPIHTLDVGSNLYVDDTDSNVLVINGNVKATGSYYGDGSKLTGIVTSLEDVANNGNTISNVIQFTNPETGFAVDSNVVVGGNVTATNFLGDGGLLSNLVTTLQDVSDNGNTTSNTIQLTNTDMGLVVDNNVLIGGTLFLGSLEFATSPTLSSVTNSGNATEETLQFINEVTGFRALSNIVVGGNVTASSYYGDGGFLSNLVTTLQDVSDNGNTTSNTLQFTNATTGLVVDSNIVVGGNVTATTFLGDGGLLSNLVTTLQDVSDNGNTTSNTLQFTNAHTAFTTDLTSNVGVKLNQLANVTLTTPLNEDMLVYDGSNWVNQLQNHTFLQAKALETISKGDVVYAAGHTGNDIFNIRKARADSSTTMPALGVAYQNLAVNGVGLVVTFGRADKLNTGDFISGETVYVSNVVAGGISNVAPQAETDLIQNVGLVVKPHAVTGIIDVTGVGRVNDIPNAQLVTTQPPHIYTNGGGNTFEKMDPADVLTKLQTLQQVTDTGNTTSNTIQFTNATTGVVTTANVEVGSNIAVAGLVDLNNKHLPMVRTDGFFEKSPVYITSGGTYVVSTAEAEFLGNLTLSGNTTIFSSNNVTIQDRIFGIGANNAVHNLDTGIMMEHKEDGDYANIAVIYHADEHRFSIGYTQNTFTDNHILHYDDPDHLMLIDLRGNLQVQNNTSIFGELVTSSNVGIANTSPVHTLDVGSNLYVDDTDSNVLVVNGNVKTTGSYYGDGSKLTGLVTTLQDVTDNGNTTSNTLQLTNATTGLVIDSNLVVGGNVTATTFLGDGGLLSNLVTTLQDVSDNGNTTSNTLQLTNATTGLVIDSNLVVGGNVTATTFIGDGGLLSNLVTTLQGVSDNGNTTSNTLQLTNATTGLVIDSNLVVGGNVTATTFLGDGGLLSNLVTTLQDVTDNGNTTSNTLQLTNATTGLVVDSNIVVNGINTRSIKTEKQVKINGTGVGASDYFGYSTDISGDTAIVGAYKDNSEQGIVYIFKRLGSTWSEQSALTHSGGSASDQFGISVSIDGNTAAIGSNGTGTNQGSTFVFTRTGSTWSQQMELNASDGASGDSFGTSVTVLGDTAVIGAPLDNSSQGSVYVFTRSGTVWTEQAKLTASDGSASDEFGVSVSMSGNTIVVGASKENGTQGAVYVFVGSGSSWSEQAKIVASDGSAGDVFGTSVSISDDTIVSGAYGDNNTQGSAYVFTRTGLTWTQQTKLIAIDGSSQDEFGISVSISGDIIVVGSQKDDDDDGSDSGSVYVFIKSGSTWVEYTKIIAGTQGGSSDQFGHSVSIDGEGSVIIGAYLDDDKGADSGSAYIFTIKRALAVNSNIIVDGYVTSTDLSVDNNIVVGRNITATAFLGDGGLLSNITTTLQSVTDSGNTTSKTLQLTNATTGLVVDSNIVVGGNVTATAFLGDGGLLSNVTASVSIQQSSDVGNTTSNTLQFTNPTTAFVTQSNVGIQNTSPTNTLSVGSNLHVDDTNSNVLTVVGNTWMQNLTLGTIHMTPAYGLENVTEVGNSTPYTVEFSNATTGLVTTSNLEVGGTLKFGGVIDFSNPLGLAAVSNVGNTTPYTIEFNNPTTGFETASNAVIGGDLDVLGNLGSGLSNVILNAIYPVGTIIDRATAITDTHLNGKFKAFLAAPNQEWELVSDGQDVVPLEYLSQNGDSTNYCDRGTMLASSALQNLTTTFETIEGSEVTAFTPVLGTTKLLYKVVIAFHHGSAAPLGNFVIEMKEGSGPWTQISKSTDSMYSDSVLNSPFECSAIVYFGDSTNDLSQGRTSTVRPTIGLRVIGREFTSGGNAAVVNVVDYVLTGNVDTAHVERHVPPRVDMISLGPEGILKYERTV
jgi:hypothetical protein